MNMNEIDWETRLESPYPVRGPLKNVTHIIDATVIRLTNFTYGTQNWKTFYSKKHKYHCWKYSGCVSIVGGEFVYFDKLGFPGINHDKKMHDLTIEGSLFDWELGIADKGYEGVTKVLTPWKGNDLSKEQKDWNYTINCHRALVENAFSRLKLFKRLNGPVMKKNRESVHKIVYTCAQLTNMDIKFRPLRKHVHPQLNYWCDLE